MGETSAGQRDLDDLDGGMDVRQILQRRVEEAQLAQDRAVAEQRSVMTDDEALEEFGIDLGEI